MSSVKIILLEEMHLGKFGDCVQVAGGFARNYLIPHEKAVYATTANLAKFTEMRTTLAQRAAEKLAQAKQQQAVLAAIGTVTITAIAGDEGKLFGSVGTRDIAQYLAESGISIDRKHITLPNGLIRFLGEYEALINLGSNITITLPIQVCIKNNMTQ